MTNKIAKCPYCKQQPERSFVKKYKITCITLNCILNNTIGWLTPDWNALCADIERGRECEEVKERIRVLEELSGVKEGYSRNLERGCRIWKEKHDVLEQHLDEAIRLLGGMSKAFSHYRLMGYEKILNTCDTFLALPTLSKEKNRK